MTTDPEATIRPFSHLFPSMVAKTPDIDSGEQPPFNPPAHGKDAPLDSPPVINHGVDYVIVFRYPIKSSGDRLQLEQKVIDGFEALATKLTHAQLFFEVKQGQERGTLLVLVGCPQARLYAEYKAQR